MSIKVTTRVWEHSEQKGSKLLVLLALSDHADDHGVCWPGVERLSGKARISSRQTQYHLRDLEQAGEIYTHEQTGRTHTNRYLVTAGLTEEEIATTLVSHVEFRYSLEDAVRIAEKVVNLRKGAADFTHSNAEKGCNPAPERVQSSAGKGAIQRTERVQSIAPEPSLESSENHHEPPDPAGEKLKRLRQKFGRDPTELALKAHQDLDKNGDRPRGWREASEEAYAICRRVADLWTSGELRWSADDIEKDLAAAEHLLRLHDGDVREALWTLDTYHAEDWDGGFNVSGPYSLRNAIPGFLNDRNGSGKVIRVGR